MDMKLHEYFKSNAEGPDALVVALVELARGCAREGYVTRVVLPHPQSCVCCGSPDGLCPMRVLVGGEQVVALMCLKCQKRVAKPGMMSRMIHEARVGAIKHPKLNSEMALLFQQGQRIRIVWGHKLGSEVLS